MSRLLVAVALTGGAWAQGSLTAPELGRTIDARGMLRAVRGVAGAFTLGESIGLPVVASACGERLCVAKTASQLVVGDVAVDAPEGAALIGIQGANAALYFPSTHEFFEWREGSLRPLDVSVEGEVLALGFAADGSLHLAVRQHEGVLLAGADGGVLDSLPSNAGAVLLVEGAVLFATGGQTVLRRGDASEVRFDLAGVESLFALGPGWVGALAQGATYALRIATGQMFQLPEAVALESGQ